MKKIILIGLALIVAACGARKTEKSKIETEKATESTAALKTETIAEAETSVYVASDEDNFSITPIDNSLPVEIIEPDGKKTIIRNGKVERSKRSVKLDLKTVEKATIKTDYSSGIKTKEKAMLSEKKTDRKASYSWIWAVLVLLVILWIVYRKYKDKLFHAG